MSRPAKNSRIEKSMEYELPKGFKAVPFDLDWNKVKEPLLG
tara:strand:+ start:136 stop:258 length:123 start_codon:yes stop_codon:yes gene_type:complete